MKKLLLVIALLMAATPAMAWNFNFWGSNDHQNDHRNKRVVPIERPEPNPPVSVPEPSSIILFGTGMIALVINSTIFGKGKEWKCKS